MTGCVEETANDPTAADSAPVGTAAQALAAPIGAPLPGTDPDEFDEVRETFAAIEDIEEGIGPIFNDVSCANCHSTPVVGGSGDQIERRFGRLTDGVFFGYDGPPADHGGTLRQLFTNGTYQFGDTTCTVPLEVEPATANVNDVGRRTTPLFGLGLVDAMPDAFFDLLAAAQPASLRGIARRVPVALPDPRDPTQGLGTLRVARFGWKGAVPSLRQFSADAYLNEMGITSQACFEGTSVLAFASENLPNNQPIQAGCNGGDLAPANPPGDPEVPELTDDVVGPCGGGRTAVSEDVEAFTTFMERLAPPPRDTSDPLGAALGSIAFAAAKCAGCHVPVPFVTPPSPFNGVPGGFAFFPYSDFLVHDMGALGDGIGDTGDSAATTRLMRTSPLWGARYNARFLHDGRAGTIREAILAHDGQAAASRQAFQAMSSLEQSLLIRFVKSL